MAERVSISNEFAAQKSSERPSELLEFPDSYDDIALRASSYMTKRLPGPQRVNLLHHCEHSLFLTLIRLYSMQNF
jgi:hypothetical protein